jgi:HEXXH motif-containing protein
MSASYQEVIGNIYMTLHPDPLTMAEAIVHEFSHNKINMLFTLDAVLENAFFPLYSSPIRPDPRPLHGVLLAVHAFLPVERMYERMCSAGHPLSEHPRFKARQQQVRENNQAATETVLENGKATPIGRGVLDEIAQWNRYFAGGGSESGASAVH